MAIRVYCDCGRKLSVSDDQAGRKTVCPVCGASVSVPKRGERKVERTSVMKMKFITREGTQEIGARPVMTDPVDSQVTIGSHAPRPFWPLRRRRRGRRTVWWESLLVPLDHTSFLVKWSLAAAVVTVVFLMFIHADLSSGTRKGTAWLLGALCVFVLPVGAVACEFLSHVAAEASRVGLRKHRWISLDPVNVMGSLGRWLLCLAAGPALVFAATAWYWTICGELRWLDRLIVFEGLSLGAGWLAFAGLLTSGRSLRGLFPASVLAAVWTLGMRSLLIAIAAGATASLFVTVAAGAMGAFTRGEILGIAWRWFFVHFATLSAAAAVMDLAGTWYTRFGEPLPEDETGPVSIPVPVDVPSIDPGALMR